MNRRRVRHIEPEIERFAQKSVSDFTESDCFIIFFLQILSNEIFKFGMFQKIFMNTIFVAIEI